MNYETNILVTGHRGMVGSAIVRRLKYLGYTNVITVPKEKLDLTNQKEVFEFFDKNQIAVVYNAAAKVGGIVANLNYPADFITSNLAIQNNIISACIKFSVERLVFLGSCCIYPKDCNQPMKEEYILSGELESTNIPYAVAKISGIISCQSMYQQYGIKSVCPMPINLFGPGDNLDAENSHIIPGLMRRIHFAKENNSKSTHVWGTGNVKREYMHVDDCADGIIFLTDKCDKGEIINVAPGTELTTRETAIEIAKVIGYEGELIQDLSKPDGTARKYACPNRISEMGWAPKLDFQQSLRDTYEIFKKEIQLIND